MRSFPFKSINGDRKYCADDFALHQKTLYTNGIIGNQDNNLQVFASEGMKIELRPGFALIEGHTFVNTSNYIVEVDYAGNRFGRIDRLVLRLDYTNREIIPILKKGIESSNPKAPEIEQSSDLYEIALADISVEKGVISITQEMIRDLRHTSLCGIASFRGKPINVSDIYIQYESDLKEIVENLRADRNNKKDIIANILKDFKEHTESRLDEFDSHADTSIEDFDRFLDRNLDFIITLVNELDKIIESENLAGEIISQFDKKQDKHMLDRKTDSKYELFFENGQLFYEEVE